MEGFERNVMLDGSVYGYHEVASIEFYVDAYLIIQVRSWRDKADKTESPTTFNTTRLFVYELDDIIGIADAYDYVEANEQFVEYIDPAQSALDEILPTLTDEQAELIPQVFPEWATDKSYAVGDRVRDDGKLYRCVQAHTSQEGWEPHATPALWVRTAPEGEIPDWIQPTGAQDAYNTGDKVKHASKVWVSLVDANVWEPGTAGTEALWSEVVQ